MSASASIDLTAGKLLDSGPIFCLGASQLLADIFDEHCLDGSVIPESVIEEVTRKGKKDPKETKKHDIHWSAKQALKRYHQSLFSNPIKASSHSRHANCILHTMIVNEERRIKKPEHVHEDGHDGEIESILLALHHEMLFVTNDRAAKNVGISLGLSCFTFMDFMSQLKGRKLLPNRRRFANEIQKLVSHGIDVGGSAEDVWGPLG